MYKNNRLLYEPKLQIITNCNNLLCMLLRQSFLIFNHLFSFYKLLIIFFQYRNPSFNLKYFYQKLMNTSITQLHSPTKSKFSVLSSSSSQSNIANSPNSSTFLQQSMHTIPRKLSPKPKNNFRQISNTRTTQAYTTDLKCSKIVPINGILRSGSSPNKHIIMASPSKQLHLGNDESTLLRSNVSNSNVRFTRTCNIEQSKPKIAILINKSGSKKNVMINSHPLSSVLLSPNKSIHYSPSPNTIIANNSSSRTNIISQTHIHKSIQRMTPVNVRMSPVKVINHITSHPIKSIKQSELQRKVKFLECRVSQMYQQKQLIQFRLNEQNIKLQYENQHLLKNISQFQSFLNQNTKHIIWQQNNLKTLQISQQKCKDADLMLKELQKSQQNQYHQSKQIHSLKASLSQVQDMLSKQIDKSLQLLEQLQNKQTISDKLESQVKDLKKMNVQLVGQNSSLITKIQDLKTQLNQNLSSKLKDKNQQQQNDKKLRQSQIYSQGLFTQMQSKLKLQQQLSERTLLQLKRQIIQNQSRNGEIIKYYQEKLQQYSLQTVQLKQKVSQYESHIKQLQNNYGLISQLQQNNDKLMSELRYFKEEKTNLQNQLKNMQKNKIFMSQQVQSFTITIAQMSQQILIKQQAISKLKQQLDNKNWQFNKLEQKTAGLTLELEESMSRQQRLKMSGSNGFSKGNNTTTITSGNCQKCDQLRKTIFKLNNHLNRSSYTSQSLIQSKCQNR